MLTFFPPLAGSIFIPVIKDSEYHYSLYTKKKRETFEEQQ